jgi:hypothetical protein
MMWVVTRPGTSLRNYVPVEAGYEDQDQRLHYAYAVVDGEVCAGKYGTHLVCSSPFSSQIYS